MGRDSVKGKSSSAASEALRLADSILGSDLSIAPSRNAKLHGAEAKAAKIIELDTRPESEILAKEAGQAPWPAIEALEAVTWRLDLRSGRVEIAATARPLFEKVFNLEVSCLEEGRFGFVSYAHPDDRDRIMALLAAGLEKPFRTHFRLIDRDGKERWIYLKISKVVKSTSPPFSDSLWLWAENDTDEKIEAERQKRQLSERILSSLFGSNLDMLQPKKFPSPSLMRQVSDKWKPIIEEKGIRWIGPDLAPLGPPTTIEGSEELLVLLMDSLLENAIEAALETKSKGQAPWIRFEYFEDGESLFLALSDSGTGVPLVHRGQIFEPFFSTRAESSPGLGLTLARSAAEWHGGTMRLDHFSKNTRFVVQIPKHFRGQKPSSPT